MFLEIENLSKRFAASPSPVQALDGVSLSLDRGQLLAVRGPSGCGKTTLLLTVGALLRPSGGCVRIDGQDPYAMSAEARSRFRARTVGFVFQQFHLVPYLTVLENVLSASLARPSPDARDRAMELVRRLGLEPRARHRANDLSTGERQRVALGRAMLNRPALLLADEPTGNLDERNARLVTEAIAQFARAGGGVLMATHDGSCAELATQVLRMSEGRLES